MRTTEQLVSEMDAIMHMDASSEEAYRALATLFDEINVLFSWHPPAPGTFAEPAKTLREKLVVLRNVFSSDDIERHHKVVDICLAHQAEDWELLRKYIGWTVGYGATERGVYKELATACANSFALDAIFMRKLPLLELLMGSYGVTLNSMTDFIGACNPGHTFTYQEKGRIRNVWLDKDELSNLKDRGIEGLIQLLCEKGMSAENADELSTLVNDMRQRPAFRH